MHNTVVLRGLSRYAPRIATEFCVAGCHVTDTCGQKQAGFRQIAAMTLVRNSFVFSTKGEFGGASAIYRVSFVERASSGDMHVIYRREERMRQPHLNLASAQQTAILSLILSHDSLLRARATRHDSHVPQEAGYAQIECCLHIQGTMATAY